MSRGILHSAPETGSLLSNVGIRELSHRELLSEQPTVADLILPGTGHSFAEEFACLLSVLCADGVPE